MSAITGIFYRDGRKVDPDQMKKMNDRLSHRGKDGSAIWCQGSVGLGHQMLWTTPESLHEKLPFHDEKAGLVITADARIDNRKELSQELSIEDKEDVSDSYFILKSYEKWGEKCPEYLLGDFAFAIWDENEEKLFCARDHMGVKPFYYYLDDKSFFFSTEIKALFTNIEVPCRLNKLKIPLYFGKILEDKKYTFYDKIFCLSAANQLELENQEYKIRKFWQLDPKLQLELDSEEEYLSKFREIFYEAVKCRLRSAFPLGFELSGGLDSSSVVCTARDLLKNNKDMCKLNTYSHIFPDFPKTDETDYIQKITEMGRINPHFLRGDIEDPFHKIRNILSYHDQPSLGAHIGMICNMYAKMNNDGIRIILSGEGGDDIIYHGNYYFKELFLSFQWKKLINEINYLSQNIKKSKNRILIDSIILPLIPEFIKNVIHYKDLNKTPSFRYLNKNTIKNIPIDKFYYDTKQNEFINSKKPKNHHYYLINTTSHQSILERINLSTSLYSIEPRYPFYDKRLVEYCYSLPIEIKFKYGWSRYILRKSMEKILPSEICWRTKKSRRGSVFIHNFLMDKDISVEDILNNPSNFIQQYINLKYYKQIYANFKVKKVGKELFDLWLFTILVLWMQNSNFINKTK